MRSKRLSTSRQRRELCPASKRTSRTSSGQPALFAAGMKRTYSSQTILSGIGTVTDPSLSLYRRTLSGESTRMDHSSVNIKTKSGVAPCHLFSASENAPAIILFMDVFGIRPAMLAMSERLASHGYRVLLPDLFYRSGPREPFHSPENFKDEKERNRFISLMRATTNAMVMEDTASYLDFLGASASAKAGCVGYCMGGTYALAAAGTFPDRIGAAASIHGARLATDQPDSPHLLAPKMKAEIYLGVAAIDQGFGPEQQATLESALKAANVRYSLDVYPNAKHGFAVDDHPVYDRDAAELHWKRILDLFGRALG
jgi:carboxymethylenebutenolidase